MMGNTLCSLTVDRQCLLCMREHRLQILKAHSADRTCTVLHPAVESNTNTCYIYLLKHIKSEKHIVVHFKLSRSLYFPQEVIFVVNGKLDDGELVRPNASSVSGWRILWRTSGSKTRATTTTCTAERSSPPCPSWWTTTRPRAASCRTRTAPPSTWSTHWTAPTPPQRGVCTLQLTSTDSTDKQDGC